MRPTLRWKIAALVAAAVVAVAVAVGVLVHNSFRDQQITNARRTAAVRLDAAVETFARTSAVDFPGAAVDPPELPAGLRELTARGHQGTEFDDDGPHPVMWAATPVGKRTVTIRQEIGRELDAVDALDRDITIAVLVSIAVVLPLAVVIADRMGQRLRRAARTANRIAAGDLDDRIGETGRARDEIAELSAAVDSMAASLQARIVTEQRFTADVAHELRTPLTGLTTAAELLPESEAAGYVRDRVRVLRTLVEDLLEVSRLDAAKETAELAAHPLARLVARSVARTGLDADVRVGGDVLVRTDPRRLDRILGNLVGNAHRHGRGPVEVCVEGPVVTVRDHGEGFPADLLRDGPQRFRTGAAERGGGYGLGLTIAAGQARLIGAELTFSNAVDGGATATLVLPIHD